MTKEIFEKNNPHPDIGKQKFRVRKTYTAWVEYDVVADSKEEAESAVMDVCGIERIKWSEGYYNDHPVEMYAKDHDMDYSSDTDFTKKIAECVPYEDTSTIDYSDPDWTENEFEWQKETA